MVRRSDKCWRILAAAGMVVGLGSPLATGQVQLQIQLGGPGVAPAPSSSEAAHLPTDRTLSRGFQRAEQSVAAGEFTPAIRFLDEVLGGDQDAFIETGAEGGFLGLKEAAARLIRDLPPAGREAYVALYGPIAERELAAAREGHDLEALQRVATRYFYTPAGLEAAYLAALLDADEGRHLAAALTLRKLLATPAARDRFEPELSLRAAACWVAAGDAAAAEALLAAAAERGGEASIAGQPQRLDPAAAKLDWLYDKLGVPTQREAAEWNNWLTYRRDAARTAVAGGGLPHLRERWKSRLLHPRLAPAFRNLSSELEQAGDLTPVAAAPLAVGDVVLIRTPHQLLAVDFESGKRIWQVEVQRGEELEELLQQTRPPGESAGALQSLQALSQRMWSDYLYQLVSSDGQRVYAIGNLDLPGSAAWEARLGRFGFQGGEFVETNRLTAYDIASQGKRVWEIDGAAAAGELAGAFFLGAPTPLGNAAYCLAEIRGAVYLVALDAATGRLEWRQQLAGLEVGVALDPERRLQALMPSYQAGMLVCPTSAGVVVGVDLASRSLAWAYRYEAASTVPWLVRDQDPQTERRGGWLNGIPVLSGGRVLLTPPESEFLHCLDLETGRLLWQQPQGEMRMIVAVRPDVAVLAGGGRLAALRLDDGKPAWEPVQLELPEGVAVSGSGFVSGDLCYLPLSSGEVAALDVREGKIVDRAPPRDGVALGNLICHRGALLSHNGASLDRYDQLETLRQAANQRLAAQPADPEALRTLGEMAYHEGRLAEAVERLEAALQLSPTDYEIRATLAQCLAAALEADFAAYRDRLPLLEELQRDVPSMGVATLRIKAEGLLRAGEPLPSAAACLELYALGAEADQSLQIHRAYRTSAVRWAAAHLAAIWDACDDAQRAELTALVTRAMEQGATRQGDDLLRRNLEFFGQLPLGTSYKRQMARQAYERGQRLTAQQWLLDLERVEDEQLRREAVALHASLLHAAGRHRLAWSLDDQLAGPLAETPCLDGQTGSQLLATWNVGPRTAWPAGRVEVTAASPNGTSSVARARSPEWGIRLDRTDAVLGRCSIVNSVRNGEIIVRDSYGQEFYRHPLEGDRRIRYPESNSMYGASRGNLLVVSDGRQLVAMNTLASEGGAEPPVLWRADVGRRLQTSRLAPYVERTEMQQRPGSFRAPRLMRDGQWIGVIGPLTSAGCVLQDQRQLTCVDTLSGQPLWSRSDLPPGCELFGDHRLLFAVPPGSREALMFSTIDGRSLGSVEVPPWEHQLALRGREILVWRPSAGSGFELFALDAGSQSVGWRLDFPRGTRVDVAESRYVLAVEPDGRTRIVDGADGTVLTDYAGPAAPRLDQVHLLAGSDRFLAIVGTSAAGKSARDVKALIPVDFPVVEGYVASFSRGTGEMQWQSPAELDRQSLMLTQPVDLPMLVFLGTIHSPSRGSRAMLTLLAIDKATGQTLYRTDDLPPPGAGLCEVRVADEAAGQVWIETASRNIQFRFTDQPRPPLPPALAEVEGSGARGSRGLMGILENGILENLRQGR